MVVDRSVYEFRKLNKDFEVRWFAEIYEVDEDIFLITRNLYRSLEGGIYKYDAITIPLDMIMRRTDLVKRIIEFLSELKADKVIISIDYKTDTFYVGFFKNNEYIIRRDFKGKMDLYNLVKDLVRLCVDVDYLWGRGRDIETVLAIFYGLPKPYFENHNPEDVLKDLCPEYVKRKMEEIAKYKETLRKLGLESSLYK